MKKELGVIVSNEMVAEDIFKMVVKANLAKEAKPGQFIDISIDDKAHLLRRPISIAEVSDNLITLYYKVIGFGTNKMAMFKPTKTIEIIGPLGNGFTLVKNKKVLIVGGGIGIAPLLELAKKLHKENEINIILGYQTKSQIYLVKDLSKYGEITITTDDGSSGIKGNPFTYLNNNNVDFDVIYACGPMVMLKALDLKFQKEKEGYLSFEARMGCGVGICYGCAIKTTRGNIRVCHEGPVFELGVVKYES